MRRSPVIAVAALAAVAAGTYAATAQTSPPADGAASAAETSRPTAKLRPCSTRIEGTRPSPGRVQPNAVVVGPVEFASNLKRIASPRAMETYRDPDGGYSIKSAVSVRAGRDVTLGIASDQQASAELTYLQSRRGRFLDSDTVRFKACDRDEPAFAHEGTVGGRTWFNGGIHVDAPMCLKLEAWVPRRAEPYRITVPVGMGDQCEAAPRRRAFPR